MDRLLSRMSVVRFRVAYHLAPSAKFGRRPSSKEIAYSSKITIPLGELPPLIHGHLPRIGLLRCVLYVLEEGDRRAVLAGAVAVSG